MRTASEDGPSGLAGGDAGGAAALAGVCADDGAARRSRSNRRSSSSPLMGAPLRPALRPPPVIAHSAAVAVGLAAPPWSRLSLRAGVSAPASHGVDGSPVDAAPVVA